MAHSLCSCWHCFALPIPYHCQAGQSCLSSLPETSNESCVVQNLSRRGLHATALEYAKLLLGLDPTDPKGVLFCIDYLAIRAQQYKFLAVSPMLECVPLSFFSACTPCVYPSPCS